MRDRSRLTRRAIGLAVMLLFAACSNDKPMPTSADGGSHSTASVPGAADGADDGEGEGDGEAGKSSGPGASSTATSHRPTSGSSPTTAGARAASATTRRLFFRMVRSDSPIRPNIGNEYDVDQTVEGGVVRTAWQMRGSESPPEHFTMTWRGDSAFGMFAPHDSGDWTDCEWQPAVAYIPPRVAATAQTYVSECEYPLPNDAGTGRVWMDGVTRVVEQRDVELHGIRHRVWVIERDWKTRNGPGGRVRMHITTKGWWSDDLQALVKQDARVIFAPDAPTHRQEWDVTLELERVG